MRRSRRVAVPQGKYREMADEDEQQFDDDGSDASVKMDVDEDEDEDDDLDVDEDEEQESPETKRQPKRPRTAMPRKQSSRSRAGTPATQRTFLRVREDIGGDDELDEEDARAAEQIIRESLGRADEISGRIQEFGEEMAESLFLDGPEGYFDQHKRRPNGSGTPFSRAPKIEYEDFARYVRESKEIHAGPRAFIASLYHTMFPQWSFELSQGFNLLFYGVGSKRSLVMEFVEQELEVPTLVTNGYNPAVTVKEVLNNCLSVLVPAETSKTFPKTPTELLNAMVRYMDAERSAKAAAEPKPAGRFGQFELCLVIHNLDGEAIRTDKEQALLARLAAIPEIMVIATVDNINAPVLWDAARLAQFNFLWHDMTTFESYTVETGHDDALALGRNRTTVGTKGAKYVLASLTAKARSLFEMLASQQLETMNDQAAAAANGKSAKSVPPVGTAAQGIELRVFYKQCVEHFIVANEANFRTMLGEFVEHKMVNITKDATGAEIIYIPFTVDALEEAIEDLASM